MIGKSFQFKRILVEVRVFPNMTEAAAPHR